MASGRARSLHTRPGLPLVARPEAQRAAPGRMRPQAEVRLALVLGSSLGWWESPGWLPREQNPSFPWQLHGSAGSYRCHLAAGPCRLPQNTGTAPPTAAKAAAAPSLPRCPRPHSREQVQPGTDLPPSLMNFPGSLCSAEGSGLTYPEAREPEDIVQSSGALRRRLTHRLRLQHDTAEGGSTRCVSL